MSAGVVLGSTERARSAHTRKSRVSGEVGMKVIPQMVEILLLHDGCVHNGWWGSREVDPAKITSDSVEVLQQLAGVNRRGDGKPKGAEGVGVNSFR